MDTTHHDPHLSETCAPQDAMFAEFEASEQGAQMQVLDATVRLLHDEEADLKHAIASGVCTDADAAEAEGRLQEIQEQRNHFLDAREVMLEGQPAGTGAAERRRHGNGSSNWNGSGGGGGGMLDGDGSAHGGPRGWGTTPSGGERRSPTKRTSGPGGLSSSGPNGGARGTSRRRNGSHGEGQRRAVTAAAGHPSYCRRVETPLGDMQGAFHEGWAGEQLAEKNLLPCDRFFYAVMCWYQPTKLRTRHWLTWQRMRRWAVPPMPTVKPDGSENPLPQRAPSYDRWSPLWCLSHSQGKCHSTSLSPKWSHRQIASPRAICLSVTQQQADDLHMRSAQVGSWTVTHGQHEGSTPTSPGSAVAAEGSSMPSSALPPQAKQ